MRTSVVGLLSPRVEVLEELALVFVFLLVHPGETFRAIDLIARHVRNLVEDVLAPDVALHDVVESIVTLESKHVDVVAVAHLVVLAPVVGQV